MIARLNDPMRKAHLPAQFDMFSGDRNEGPDLSPQPARRPARQEMSEADMVASLEASGRYRVLRKLEPRKIASQARPGFPLRGIILDTETTGLDHRKEEIIEIGLIAFTFDDQGNVGDVTAVYAGLQQPGKPISPEITKLTGITDEMVFGQAIDMRALNELVAPADLVVAHNAGFDRPFCEALSPDFVNKAWACSNMEIDWAGRGFEGRKLGYLIGQAGYFHDGHRALDDCFALLEVLDRKPEENALTPFAELFLCSQRSRVRVFAHNSPFDLKDHLKARGYRWSDGSDGRPKAWWIEVDETDLADELGYLRTEIYRHPDADPLIRYLTAFDRFRS